MNFPVVEACGIDGLNETVAAFREEGIDRFAIVLDPETYESCFGADATEESFAGALADAGIYALHNIDCIDESCLVFLSISVWADPRKRVTKFKYSTGPGGKSVRSDFI